jgi:hypothetical protein
MPDARQAIEAIICSYDWPCADAVGIVYGNASCPWGESSGDPSEVYAGNYGLWQINESVWRGYFGEQRWAHVLEPAENTRMAWEIYQLAGGSFSPWSCAP